jgi:hypothetical protein
MDGTLEDARQGAHSGRPNLKGDHGQRDGIAALSSSPSPSLTAVGSATDCGLRR